MAKFLPGDRSPVIARDLARRFGHSSVLRCHGSPCCSFNYLSCYFAAALAAALALAIGPRARSVRGDYRRLGLDFEHRIWSAWAQRPIARTAPASAEGNSAPLSATAPSAATIPPLCSRRPRSRWCPVFGIGRSGSHDPTRTPVPSHSMAIPRAKFSSPAFEAT